jgi:threonyl-tRNA synthetase
MKIFGFDYEVELSTRPENSIGTDQDWELATNALESALKDNHMSYDINEGDGAFYGPKIDFKLKDALKRKWQCATILRCQKDLILLISEQMEKSTDQ